MMLDSDPMITEYSATEAHVSPEQLEWGNAAKAGLGRLLGKSTWQLIDLPPGHRAIGNH